jgi:hypothetical protein
LPASGRTRAIYEPCQEPGISLWTLWTGGSETVTVAATGLEKCQKLREDAERAELRPAPAPELVAGHVDEVVKGVAERLAQEPRGGGVV